MSELITDRTSKRHRQIRSFVRREGRITPSQQQALDSLWPKYGIDYVDSQADITEFFEREAPVSVDIGFGNGLSLLTCAQQKSNWNHLGIEVHRPGVGRLLAQAEDKNLANIKVICADAVDVFKNMITDDSVDRVLIFFPDPWPKKRHHKRRLIQSEFVQLVAQKLKHNAVLHLATDWQPYAEWMLEVMENENTFSNLAGTGNFSDKPDYRSTTKFETRGQKLGHGVYDLIYQRV